MGVLSSPLPADLPTNWANNQVVAPNGPSVGLTQQHGYNYLMQQVNATQSAINQIDTVLTGGVAKIQSGTYIGTGTYGINNPNSITCDFAPKIVLCGCQQYDITNYIFHADSSDYSAYGIMLVDMLTTEYNTGLGFSPRQNGSSAVGQTEIAAKKSSDGQTIDWYSKSANQQNNRSGETYYWLAIG